MLLHLAAWLITKLSWTSWRHIIQSKCLLCLNWRNAAFSSSALLWTEDFLRGRDWKIKISGEIKSAMFWFLFLVCLSSINNFKKLACQTSWIPYFLSTVWKHTKPLMTGCTAANLTTLGENNEEVTLDFDNVPSLSWWHHKKMINELIKYSSVCSLPCFYHCWINKHIRAVLFTGVQGLTFVFVHSQWNRNELVMLEEHTGQFVYVEPHRDVTS